ncbi:GntR family transcriptional regulator [Novosphingobium sp. AAP83]|uniref:FadR/GntR family transcriptional regulator n=1 Tax=Novosphingobium sp. AAP83 TaxID=1523425 RepID=UPI0006B91F23|nr:FCD domain-containing protein [Novosphingobium sp. AAP83]KPF89740.1 GntR family transcriptional regulator [Novosphingobium sp. AAP83]
MRLRTFLDETVERGEQRLPPEPRLSEEIGVSRGRLRTLLRKLEEEGAIWRHVGKGTFVGPRNHANLSAAAVPYSMDDLLQARIVLEPQLASVAAMHSTPDDIALMDACLAEMQLSTSMLQWKRLDERLHHAIANATHNPLLLMLYDTLRAQTQVTYDRRIEEVLNSDSRPKQSSQNEHGEVVEAIRNHDPVAAENAMRSHLKTVKALLFGLR